MSTRSALALTLSVTVVRGRVNLNAFCRRLPDDRREDLPVGLDGDAILDRARSLNVMPRACASIVAAGVELVDEFRDEELLQILDALGEPDLGERAADERVQPHEAAMEHGPGAPADADVPGLEHVEREDRRVDQVPQLVREEPEALAPARRLAIGRELIAIAPVLGHGARRWRRPGSCSASESLPC